MVHSETFRPGSGRAGSTAPVQEAAMAPQADTPATPQGAHGSPGCPGGGGRTPSTGKQSKPLRSPRLEMRGSTFRAR